MRPKILKQCKIFFKTVTGLFKYVAVQIKSAGFANLTEGEFSFVKKGILEEYKIHTETRVAQQEWTIF